MTDIRPIHRRAAQVAQSHREALAALADAGYFPLDRYVEIFGPPKNSRDESASLIREVPK